MSWCSDPYEHEREGREAARWGERFDADHRDRMREASWNDCDRAYRDGYEREIRHREEIAEEERREKRRADDAAQERARQNAIEEEMYWAARYQEEPIPISPPLSADAGEGQP